ncbi:hypothetical protein CLV43_10199 [Umezawaea tangerina]|uniref:Uncharacterized protein n=1 Tax=Umezawaea tangerina TaxID=84725 RepID=A0A2T0TJP1_9PSEU|nr:hypothetical protein CLV43_10199 [Umezawaea tangerina]
MSAVDERAGMGARRVRRALGRALLVLGGAAAGTAAAWVLSTATAAAEAPESDVVTAVSAGASQHQFDEVLPARMNTAVDPVVAPATQTVAGIDQALRAEQEKARAATTPKLEEVADQLRGGFDEVGSWFEPRWAEVLDPSALLPVGKTASAVSQVSPTTSDVVAPATVGTPVVEAPATHHSRFGDQWAQQPVPPRTAQGDESRPDFPGDRSPVPFAPFAPPVNTPVHCSCGGDGSGSAGSQNSASQAAFVNAYNSAVARALKPTTERISVLPGKQPGSTPD